MRLFVAVWPDAAVVQAVAALARPEHPDVRWTRPESWHVTLRFLGEVEGERVPSMMADLQALAEAPVGRARLGPATCLLEAGLLAAPVTAVDDLAVRVAVALGEVGDRRRFRGHLTLARARRHRILPPAFAGQSIEGEWPVTEVTLVRSQLGQPIAPAGQGPYPATSSAYEVIGTVPLRPA